MAWITGKVQQFEKKKKSDKVIIGEPFAIEKNGTWFSLDGRKLKVIKGKIDDLQSKRLEDALRKI